MDMVKKAVEAKKVASKKKEKKLFHSPQSSIGICVIPDLSFLYRNAS